MTLEEKIGQLFINHNNDYSPEYLDGVLENYHVGGMRYRPGPSAAVQEHIRYAQSKSKVPLLIASNPEMGGAGSCDDGTFVSHPPAGRLAPGQVHRPATWARWPASRPRRWAATGRSRRSWTSTTTGGTRSSPPGPSATPRRSWWSAPRSTSTASASHHMACAMKHFPGDGIDERDQHVVTSYNTLGYDEWNQTYGHVYREMIGHGVQSIMVGHIGAPELSRHFRPGIADKDILPATLAPELLQDLLRGELGFNGLILTDASQMIGLTQAMKRRDLVPATIAAGCDMFLFFRNPAEDFGYMLDGYKSGVITEQRLQDALRRILALKASLGLHRKARERPRSAGRRRWPSSAARQHRAVAAADRRQDRHPGQGHRAQPAHHAGNAQTDPAVRHLRRLGLHPHGSAGLPGHGQGRTGERRLRGARVQDGRPARGRGGDRRQLHVRHLRGSHAATTRTSTTPRSSSPTSRASPRKRPSGSSGPPRWRRRSPGTSPRSPRCSSR